MKSDILKNRILEYFLWERNFLLGVGEFDNGYGRADVFFINKRKYSYEFEIKVSRSDLMSELNTLKLIYNNSIPNKSKKYNKYIKHNAYLDKNIIYNKYYIIPNYFNYFIPKELLKDDIIEIINNTPYGLYIYDKEKRIDIKCIIKSKKIHKEKIIDEQILSITKRLSSENISLRNKLLKNNIS